MRSIDSHCDTQIATKSAMRIFEMLIESQGKFWEGVIDEIQLKGYNKDSENPADANFFSNQYKKLKEYFSNEMEL